MQILEVYKQPIRGHHKRNIMRAREFTINVPITIKINGDGDPEIEMDQDTRDPLEHRR